MAAYVWVGVEQPYPSEQSWSYLPDYPSHEIATIPHPGSQVPSSGHTVTQVSIPGVESSQNEEIRRNLPGPEDAPSAVMPPKPQMQVVNNTSAQGYIPDDGGSDPDTSS